MRLFLLLFFYCNLTLLGNRVGLLYAQDRLRAIEGVVTSESGKPIEGAFVEWGYFQDAQDKREIVRTDENGHYRIETKRVGPSFRVGVSAIGYAPSWQDAVIPALIGKEPTQVDFKLGSPMTLRGKVVDKKGRPIEGVTVSAKSPVTGFHSSFSTPTPSFPFPGPAREATSDAQGNFTIRYLPVTGSVRKKGEPDRGSAYEIQIGIKGHSMMIMGKGYSAINNEFSINRSYTVDRDEVRGEIRGEVFDKKTDKPIKSFQIVIRHTPRMRAFENENGKFLMDNFHVNRNVQFFVYAMGYAPFVARPFIHEETGTFVSCGLVKKKGIEGIVVNQDGDPIEGAKVVAGVRRKQDNNFYWGAFDELVDGHHNLTFVQRLTTGANGKFSFAVGDDRPLIALIAPGYARKLLTRDEVFKATKAGQLRIKLDPECAIRGKILLNDKPEPEAHYRVTKAESWSLDFGWDLKADQEGCFELSSLEAGTYKVSVYTNTRSVSTSRLSYDVQLVPGETQDLVLDSPGGSSCLKGKTSPFSIVTATVKNLDGGENSAYTTVGAIASPEGEYEIQNLHPGTYTVSVHSVGRHYGNISAPSSKQVKVTGETVFDAESQVFYFGR